MIFKKQSQMHASIDRIYFNIKIQMIRSQNRRTPNTRAPVTPSKIAHSNKQNGTSWGKAGRPGSSYDQILQEVKNTISKSGLKAPEPRQRLQAKLNHSQLPSKTHTRVQPRVTTFAAEPDHNTSLKHHLEPSTVINTTCNETMGHSIAGVAQLHNSSVDISNYYSQYHPNSCVRKTKEKENQFRVKARNISNMHERVQELLSKFYKNGSRIHSSQEASIQPRQERGPIYEERIPIKFQYQQIILAKTIKKAEPPRGTDQPFSHEFYPLEPADRDPNSSILQRSSMLHSILPPIEQEFDYQIQQDIINAYNRQLHEISIAAEQPSQVLTHKCAQSHIFAAQSCIKEGPDEDCSEYSNCIEDIDRSILRVRQRIASSEQTTKLLESKYRVKTGQEEPRTYEPLLNYSANSSQSDFASQGSQSVGNRIAGLLDAQMGYDRELRQYRQLFSQLPDEIVPSTSEPKVSKWQLLRNKLSQSNILNTGIDQLQSQLQICNLELDPFLKGPALDPATLLDQLASHYIVAEQHWKHSLLHSIPKEQAQRQGFCISALDMNKEGYVSVEDLVCFVNMCTRKLYRVRDALQIVRRLGGAGYGSNQIGYGVLEGALFY